MLSGFSWEPDYHRYSIARGLSILSVSARWADLPTRRLPTSFNLRFRRQAGVSLLRLHIAPISSNGIFTVSSIGYAVRLRLRARLTLIRLALIRNPWSCGEEVSRLLYRYLYLHLLFHCLQPVSRQAFCDPWNAPLPIFAYSIASVNSLCPIIIHAEFLD